MARRKIIYNNWIAENGVDPELPLTKSFEDELFISIDEVAKSLVDPELPLTKSFEDELFISIDEVAKSLVDPASSDNYESDIAELRDEVRSAVSKLNEEERELVERVYFLGMTLQELADKSGRRRHSLEALNRRCRKKLIRHLSRFVEEWWGKRFRLSTMRCVICASIHRQDIDRLIAERDQSQTWKPVLRAIHDKYRLPAITPQLLRGHEQYH